MSKKISIKPARLSVVLFASSLLVAIVAQMFLALPARAICTDPDGVVYESGEEFGPYTCMPDGSWQQQ